MVRNLPKGFEDQQAFWKFGTSLCTREERMLITNEDPPQKMILCGENDCFRAVKNMNLRLHQGLFQSLSGVLNCSVT